MKKIKLLIILVFVGLTTTNIKAQSFIEVLRASASDAKASAKFGNAVSISGDKAVVGSSNWNSTTNNYAGSAYIFELIGGIWTETAQLNPSDPDASDYFGNSVSISGDKVIVGSHNDDDGGSASGSAYIFELSGGVWTQTQKLTASDPAAFDYFGYSVSVSGDKAIVGSYSDDDVAGASGSAYIFELSGGTWSETQKLLASDAAANDNFGKAVSISGDKVIIGCHQDDDDGSASGSAYIFELSGGTWSETQKLTASDAAASDNFGLNVVISGTRVIIGAENDDDDGSSSGSAYIFDLSGGVWSETQKLTASDAAASDKFGNGVSVSGDIAIIGSFQDDDGGTSTGSAYIFELSGGTWSEIQKLAASDAATYAYFGSSVGIDAGKIIVGATGSNIVSSNEGATYFYKYCAPINGTHTITECDSLVWIDGLTYYTDNNIATFNIIGGANGCDSLVTLDLTIINTVTGTDTRTECDSLVWIDGMTYYSSNNTATFNLVGQAANTCDSIVTLDLTIINSVTGTDTRTECNSYLWIDGNTYTSSNNTATFNLVGQAANTCDSLVTLDLTIINSATGTDIQSHCISYTWMDGNTYTASNNTATYNLVDQAANGCDSLVTLNLTIIPVDINVIALDPILTSTASFSSIDTFPTM